MTPVFLFKSDVEYEYSALNATMGEVRLHPTKQAYILMFYEL